jgi:hypothetical protein
MEEKKLKFEEVENDTTITPNQETITLKNQENYREAEMLMRLANDPKTIKAYRSIRSDIYGIGERRAVSKKERQKKKAKRRMAKKSKR